MKNVIWQNGMRTIKQVLDWFQSAKEQNIKERIQDYSQLGICKSTLNEFTIIIGDNNTDLTPSVTIRTGSAYDVNGDRIIISDETVSYDPSQPTSTTNDGLGNFVPTPQSTGSRNVFLSTNIKNYLWIDYLATTDINFWSLNKVTRAKQFYKQLDGYKITVTTVNTPPTANSLFLGSVDLSRFGVVSSGTISQTGRATTSLIPYRVRVQAIASDLSDKTTSYVANGQPIYVEDHIKAIGNGIISANNPHGLTATDIGLSSGQTVEQHQRTLHSSGIEGDSASVVSSLFGHITLVDPGLDFLTIDHLSSVEGVTIDGVSLLSSDIPSDTIVSFSASDANVTWYIYVDKNLKSINKTQVNLITSPDVTKFLLYSVVWTYSVPNGDLTALTDLRVFGNIATREIQNGAITSPKITAPLQLSVGSVSIPTYSFLGDTGTGMYRSGSGILSFTSSGVLSASMSGGQISGTDGTVGTPSYSFLSDPNTGIYHPSSDNISLTLGGVQYASFSTTSIYLKGQLTLDNGTVSAPSFTFNSDTNTGIYHSASDNLNFTLGGVDSLALTPSSITGFFPYYGVVGTVGAPTFSFTTDTNTGIYHPASDQLGITTGGALQWNFSGSLLVASSGTQIQTQNGSATVPTYSFVNETNTGLYRPAASNIIGMTVSGAERARVDLQGFKSTINGLAIAPSYSFTSDIDSGMFLSTVGNVGLATNGLTSIFMDSNGQVTKPRQCAFHASTDNIVNGVSNVGYAPMMNYNTVYFDIDSNFNATTGTFTAPVTGIYLLSARILSSVYSGTVSNITVTIFYSATASADEWTDGSLPIGNQDQKTSQVYTLARMSAGDTADLEAHYFGSSTFQVDVFTAEFSATLLG